MNQELYSFYLVDDDIIFNYTHQKIIEAFFKKHPHGIYQIPYQIVYQIQSFDNPLQALSFFENDFSSQSGSGLQTRLRNILLVDINMPFLDGFEFIDKFDQITRIHSLTPSADSEGGFNSSSSDSSRLEESGSAGNLPVSDQLLGEIFETYILSSSLSSSDKDRAQQMPTIKGYLEKPLSDAQLLRLLEKLATNPAEQIDIGNSVRLVKQINRQLIQVKIKPGTIFESL